MIRAVTSEEACEILSIQRLLFSHLRATDSKDWPAFEDTLADEVAIEFKGLQPAATVSRIQLRKQSEPIYAPLKTQHMAFNLDIRVDGDRALSTSYGRARHELVGAHKPALTAQHWHIYARYEHSYIRTSDGWRIARILMEPLWEDGDRHLLGA